MTQLTGTLASEFIRFAEESCDWDSDIPNVCLNAPTPEQERAGLAQLEAALERDVEKRPLPRLD